MKPPKLLKDLGMRFPTATSQERKRYGLYECSYCGTEFETQVQSVKSGNTSSCGCQAKQNAKTHGLRDRPLYQVWANMMNRCTNPKTPDYEYYGGRGIKVSKKWRHDFKAFYDDMHPTYKPGLTLDRINVDGNYKKSNCRWSTRTTQSQNTRAIMSTNTSGYRGVSHHGHNNRFQSQIGVKGKKIYLGIYDTALEAARAYDSYVVTHNLEHTLNNVL